MPGSNPPTTLKSLKIGDAGSVAKTLPGFGSFQDNITTKFAALGASGGLLPAALGSVLSLDLDPSVGLLNPSGVFPSDGDLVASWADARANGLTATQATTANQPQFIKNAFNAMPAVRYNGPAFMTMADNVALRPDSQPFRAIIVFRVTNISATRTLLSKGNGSSGAQGYSLILDTASFVESAYVRAADSSGGKCGQNVANPPYQINVLELALDGAGAVAGFLNGTSTGWTNGGEGTSGAAYTPPISNTDALNIMAVGGVPNGVAYQSVDVFRILILKGALT